MTELKAHKTMTPEEYAVIPMAGWHLVCRDYDGCGGTGIRLGAEADMAELGDLRNEIEQLREQSRLGDAAIDQLTKEREDYRMRWLGSMTTRDAQLIRDEHARLMAAASKLAREVKAAFGLYEPLARREMGNSNYQIITDAADEVIALTSTGEQAPSTKES